MSEQPPDRTQPRPTGVDKRTTGRPAQPYRRPGASPPTRSRSKAWLALPIAFVALVLAYLTYDLVRIKFSSPCEGIFQQTAVNLKTNLDMIGAKGEAVVGRERIQELTAQAQVVALNLKTCCIMSETHLLDASAFLECKGSAERYESGLSDVARALESQSRGEPGAPEDVAHIEALLARNMMSAQALQHVVEGAPPINRNVLPASPPSVPVVKTVSSEANGIGNPEPLQLGVIYEVTLEKNEESYFRLSSPARDFKIVLDMRRADNRDSNLISALSILDEDGAVVQDGAVGFNEIDVDHRKTAIFSLGKQPAIVGFKLLNEHDTATFWLTVREKTASQLIPFFAKVVPQAMRPGEPTSGVLDVNEDVYYTIPLPRGDYKVVVDFSNSNRQKTNIQGYLALLDSDGGNQAELIQFNEIDVSYRKVAVFSLQTDANLIAKISNRSYPVDYTVEIAQKR